ncbi:MAG: hypothetical protein HYX53_17470 [Chloroflexi bacterium]|nr:hypothetical protein [Chloroflexota bacterium]
MRGTAYATVTCPDGIGPSPVVGIVERPAFGDFGTFILSMETSATKLTTTASPFHSPNF